MPNKIQRINIFVLTVVIIYTILLQQYLANVTIINPILDFVITLLSSIGLYKILISLLYSVVNNNKFLKKLYWGKLYLEGLWSYTYVKEGTSADNRFFGIWRFEQDLYSIRIIGFGLNNNFETRSWVNSVTDIIERNGVYEVVNIRSDSIDPERKYYSLTSMTFDKNDTGMFSKHPVKLRAKTIIYGGTLSGQVHKDIFKKYENANTEDELINDLKHEFSSIADKKY